jgi:uncharacterized coiled-coil DUF342 family protein
LYSGINLVSWFILTKSPFYLLILQDLFVDRLVERVDKLKEEIAMYDAQITAQAEETKVAKEALMEAQTEIEAINLEKKQLFQQWSSSLIGMRRRDEAHAAMNEALK